MDSSLSHTASTHPHPLDKPPLPISFLDQPAPPSSEAPGEGSNVVALPTVVSLPLKTPSWSGLFQGNATKLKTTLDHVDTFVKDGVVEIPESIVEEGVSIWKDYIVGFFIEQRLPYPLVKESLAKQWKIKGSYSMVADRDIFYFKFLDESDRQLVLEIGPIFIGGKLFVVRPWTQEVEKLRKDVKTIPIWANLYNIPKELWSEKGLSYLASLMGKPVCLDEATAKRERLNFARVCIEVNLDFTFKTNWQYKMGDESIREFVVEYPWKPAVCTKCNTFGHSLQRCQKKSEGPWIPPRRTRRFERGQPSNQTQRFERGQPSTRYVPKAVQPSATKPTNSGEGVQQPLEKGKAVSTTPVLSNRFQALNEDIEENNEDEDTSNVLVASPISNSIAEPINIEFDQAIVAIDSSVAQMQENDGITEPALQIEVVVPAFAINDIESEVEIVEKTPTNEVGPASEHELVKIYASAEEIQQFNAERERYAIESDGESLSSLEEDIDDELEPEYFKDHLDGDPKLLPIEQVLAKSAKEPETTITTTSKKKVAYTEGSSKTAMPESTARKARGRPKGSGKSKA
ncbi:Rna exonuclease [Thalictrum thalictroides]|uniref:Rna exonuclease n=1 Tax=Thalictrum thalictroides TaxID=46969 RepID=A0A7J6VR17_THATH|nr:Rna exonuclease [Thalictrum thalictroides]